MGGEGRWYLPREVAELLGIPASTLRTYAANLGALLSDRARPGGADGKGFRHRRYDDADLRVLREAKDLLDAGMSYQATLARLGGASFNRPAPRRRRPGRGHSRPATTTQPHGSAAIIADPPPEPPADHQSRQTAERIDQLHAEIQCLRADLAATIASPVEPPSFQPIVDPALLESIAVQLAQIQTRLERLEIQLATLAAPPSRPNWLARLIRRE